MTKELAIRILTGDVLGTPEQTQDAVSMAVKALSMPSAQPYALDEWCDTCKEYDSERHCCPRYNRVIRDALKMRKRGKWIYNSPVTMKCDQCEFVIKDWECHRFKFCPNCQADMREGGEE